MSINRLSKPHPSIFTNPLTWKTPHIQWSPSKIALYLGAGFVSLLILIVPIYLLIRTVGAGSSSWELLTKPSTLKVLSNTILLAMAVTLATNLLAVPLAYLTSCTDLPAKRLWAVLAALPLVIPSYVGAYLYASILSPKGLLQQFLAPLGIERLPSLYGFTGAFLVLTLVAYPYTFLTVRAALNRMDPALIEAARSLGVSPQRAFWRVTLPYLRPSIIAGSLLVALYTLRDFGAVTLWQYSTFTRVIYNRYMGYRLDTAASMGLVLVLLTAVLLYFEYRTRHQTKYERVSIGVARRPMIMPLGRWKLPALFFVGSIVFVALIVPCAGLLYWVARGMVQEGVVGAGTNIAPLIDMLQPAINSLTASALGAGLAILLALPIAILVVRKPSKLSHFFERITYASFALPGIVVALAYVFVGTNMARPLYQTLPMLLFAYVILFIPQAVGAQRASLMQVPASLEEAGRSLGKRPFATFRAITLPLVKPGVLAGGILVFLTCMKELPATLILSPLGFSTLASQVWTHINEAFFAQAALPTLLLLLLSSIPLAFMTIRERLDS